MTQSASGKTRRRLTRGEDGVSAVEFAIIAPFFFVLVFGIVQVSFAYFQGATMQWAVERAVRTAMIDADASAAEIQDLVDASMDTIGTPDIALTYDIEDGGPVTLAHVTASYGIPVEIPMVPEFTLNFSVNSYIPVPET